MLTPCQFLLCAQVCLPCLLLLLLLFHTISSYPSTLALFLFSLSDSDSNDGDQGKVFVVSAPNTSKVIWPFWDLTLVVKICCNTQDHHNSSSSNGPITASQSQVVWVLKRVWLCVCVRPDALCSSDNRGFGDSKAQPFNAPLSSSSPIYGADGWVTVFYFSCWCFVF